VKLNANRSGVLKPHWWLVGALILGVMLLALVRLPYYLKAHAMRVAREAQAERIFTELKRTLALKVAGVKLGDLYLPCSGKQTAPFMNRGHPTARLWSSSITPTSNLSAGQIMHATAKVKCPPGAGLPIFVHSTCIGVNGYAPLYDDGTHGDRVVRDGVWEADVVWEEDWFEGDKGWASVILALKDYQYIDGKSIDLKRQIVEDDQGAATGEAEVKQ
jgi:hypothetical protein